MSYVERGKYRQTTYATDYYYAQMQPSDLAKVVLLGDNKQSKATSKWRDLELESNSFDRQMVINGGFHWSSGVVGYLGRNGKFITKGSTEGNYDAVWIDNKLHIVDMYPHEIEEKFPNFEWVLSGSMPLIIDGVVTECNESLIGDPHNDHPRTVIGQKKDGTFLSIVIEGRNSNDKGMTAKECQSLMVAWGCVNAILLDGGGSSTMVDDRSAVQNYLPDGHERAVWTALAYYVHVSLLGDVIVPEVPFEPTEGKMRAIYGMEFVRFSQARHGQGFSLDEASKDTGVSTLNAPFDCIVKRLYDYDNTMWVESLVPVEIAKGIFDYVTLQLTHDDKPNWKVGDKIKQLTPLYDEGKKNATGNHIHIEVAIGKFVEPYGWHKVDPINPSDYLPNKSYTNMKNGWRLINAVDPEEVFFFLEGYNEIIDNKDVDFKWTDSAIVIEAEYTDIELYEFTEDGQDYKFNIKNGNSGEKLLLRTQK